MKCFSGGGGGEECGGMMKLWIFFRGPSQNWTILGVISKHSRRLFLKVEMQNLTIFGGC